MRIFYLLTTSLFFAVPCVLLIFILLIMDQQPDVVRSTALSPEHIERAKKIIETHRRQANSNFLSRVNILSEDLDIAANYLANHFGQGSAKADFSQRQAKVQASFPMPVEFIRVYINLTFVIVQTKSMPRIQSIRIGQLSLPNAITDFLWSQGVQWLRMNPEYRKGFDAIKFVHVSKNEVSVLYRWDGKPPKLKSDLLALNAIDQQQIRYYQSLLAHYSHQIQDRSISLSTLLQPLMQSAQKRPNSGDMQSENKAVLLVATLHVLGISIKELLPDAETWPRPKRQLVLLHHRNDFAKHFLVSAAIAAYADTVLADAIGLYKEIEDARSGSGFSFDDILADRAGVQFGEKAVADEMNARQLQALVAAGLNDTDLMPHWSDLPVSLSESEFRRRFGHIDSLAYQQIMQEIERRVATLPFAMNK